MEPHDLSRAIAAATEVASSLGLPADSATVLHHSNKLALRLTPCNVVARVTHADHEGAQLEVDRARRLAAAGCPVGVVEPRVDPLVYVRDVFAVTLWTYYEPATPRHSAVDYAQALIRLHAGMRTVDLVSPRFTDRIVDAEQVADNTDLSPELTEADRMLLGSTLRSLRRAIDSHEAEEQLLHGEPHPGNVLSTTSGPLVIDFETSCHGPIEFDLAHVPEEVCDHYPGVNQELLADCRHLVLAMVAAWRWRLGDQFPNRRRWGQAFLHSLRDGPPWPTLDTMARRLEDQEQDRADR
jgi:aminoglycoside phosphotransferase (APT) family kinase protein